MAENYGIVDGPFGRILIGPTKRSRIDKLSKAVRRRYWDFVFKRQEVAWINGLESQFNAQALGHEPR